MILNPAVADGVKNFRLVRSKFRLALRAAFSRVIALVRLFEAVGIDVGINLRR